MHAEARDAFEQSFAAAGALAFVNESSESAARSALYHAVAERKPAGPWAPVDQMQGEHR